RPAGRPPTRPGGGRAASPDRASPADAWRRQSTGRSSRRVARPAARWHFGRVWRPTEQSGPARRAHPPVRPGGRIEGGITLEHHTAPPALSGRWINSPGCLLRLGLTSDQSRVGDRAVERSARTHEALPAAWAQLSTTVTRQPRDAGYVLTEQNMQSVSGISSVPGSWRAGAS